MASHLAGADGVLFSPQELIKDVVAVDMETLRVGRRPFFPFLLSFGRSVVRKSRAAGRDELSFASPVRARRFVVDPTKLDSRSTIKAVSLHYKVEIESGVIVKSSPLAFNRDGSKPHTFGVKGKWTCVEVEIVKDAWVKLSRNEVDKYKGTHTYETIAEERGGEEFVECWMPAAHLKPVIVNPLVDDNASLVPVAVVDPNEKKRRGLRPSERRALRDAGLDDSQIQKPKPKLRR